MDKKYSRSEKQRVKDAERRALRCNIELLKTTREKLVELKSSRLDTFDKVIIELIDEHDY